MYFQGQIWRNNDIVGIYGANIQFKIDLFGQYYIWVMFSYDDKNIHPDFLEKIRTWKNAEILKT